MEPRDPRQSFAPVAEKYLTSAPHAKPDALLALAERVGKTPGTVLDVGTGAGHTAYALSRVAEKVIAVDITPEMLAIVSRELEKRGLDNIETCLAAADSLPFENGSMAGVATRLAAHHFPDVEAFVAESQRVTSPGGWLLIVDTIGPEDPQTAVAVDRFEAKRDPSHVHDLSVSEWSAMIESNGYRIEWVDTARKTLELEDWMARMEVPEPIRAELRQELRGSLAGLRTYLNPQPGPPATFDLWEMTLFARLVDSQSPLTTS
ncbi:MAG: class I SAM-dependent methyltransferase [Armatimonadetes bacterium]|nr:class I SAM-dependent methyltransferase [Armatimonadota bacterium]